MKNGNNITGNTMSKPRLFLDSSVLFAGIISAIGAARALLLLSEARQINLLVSEQVIAETERALARKAPLVLNEVRRVILLTEIQVVRNPPLDEVKAHLYWMADPADVPILLSPMRSRVDYLITLNRRHFLDDPMVAQRSGLMIGTPGEALNWVRSQIKMGHN